MSASLGAGARRRALAIFALLLASELCVAAVQAEEARARTVPLSPIMVSAADLTAPEDRLGSSVTFINGEAIERKQERAVEGMSREDRDGSDGMRWAGRGRARRTA